MVRAPSGRSRPPRRPRSLRRDADPPRSLARREGRPRHRRVRRAGRLDDRVHGRDRRRLRVEAAGGGRGIHRDGGAAPRAEHVRRRSAPPDRIGPLARARTAGWTAPQSGFGRRGSRPGGALPLERLHENVNFQAPSLVLWMADGITGLWPLTLIPLAAVAFVVVLGRGHRSRLGCWAVVGVLFAPPRSPPTGRCPSRAGRRAPSGSARTHAGSITPRRAARMSLRCGSRPDRRRGLRTRHTRHLDERVLQPLGRKGRRGRHADALRPSAHCRLDQGRKSSRTTPLCRSRLALCARAVRGHGGGPGRG